MVITVCEVSIRALCEVISIYVIYSLFPIQTLSIICRLRLTTDAWSGLG